MSLIHTQTAPERLSKNFVKKESNSGVRYVTESLVQQLMWVCLLQIAALTSLLGLEALYAPPANAAVKMHHEGSIGALLQHFASRWHIKHMRAKMKVDSPGTVLVSNSQYCPFLGAQP